ncbi:Autophagy protein 5 [Coniothyrium glycines]
MSSRDVTSRLRERVWHGSIPLEIRLYRGDCRTYDDSEPYLVQFPRLSYLGLLTHRIHAFFASNVPLKWHYPLGLLFDLYSGAEPAYPPDTLSPPHKTALTDDEPSHLPWRLTVRFSDYPSEQLIKLDDEDKHLHDLFMHSVKEADYLRTGTGKTVMFLSKENSTQLWSAVKTHDFALFSPISHKLLNPQGVNLRHIPIRLYLPHAASDASQKDASPGSVRVVQALVTPNLSSRQPQTIGTALNQILPTLFPSRRSPLLAQAVLHGAVLPLGAGVEELVRVAAYLDGWLHVAVVMMA